MYKDMNYKDMTINGVSNPGFEWINDPNQKPVSYTQKKIDPLFKDTNW